MVATLTRTFNTEDIVTRTALKRVIAFVTDNDVVQGRTDDGVLRYAAMQFGNAGQRDCTEVEGLVVVTTLDDVEPGTPIDLFDTVGCTKVTLDTDYVVTSTANDSVVAFTSPKHVITTAGLNQEIVISGMTIKDIVTTLAVDHIATRGALEGFRRVGTFD